MFDYIKEIINTNWLTSHTAAGLIHFVSAFIGLFLGLGVLFLEPGSKTHKIAGYIFIPTLLIVDISAFFIHEMGMRFGPFHYIIPVSLVFLFMGIKPFLFKTADPKKRMKTHIRGMVGAALGLWAAFTAELVARTPALSSFLSKFGDDSFWIGTSIGLASVLAFVFIIVKVIRFQDKRLGL